MKKILILVTALAMTIGATAQENPLTYGVKAGINLSQISAQTGDFEGDASDMKIGFFVSGHVNYSFGEFFGIQPELSFSMQGGQEDLDGESMKMMFNYINVPVLFEVKPITNLSIFVGPQIGFNIYKGVSYMGETISGSDLEDGMEMKVNTIDFAAVVGLQYAINGQFLISARYNIGFTPIFDADGVSGLANRVIQVGVGYKF